MSYTLHFAFGATAAQTIHAQLLTDAFATTGAPITTGITEVGDQGHYGYVGSLDNTFNGFMKFYVSGDTDQIVALFAITAHEVSPLDAIIDNSESMEQILRLMASTMLGKTSPGTGGWTSRDLGDSKNVVVATLDTSGYRTDMSTDSS